MTSSGLSFGSYGLPFPFRLSPSPPVWPTTPVFQVLLLFVAVSKF